MLDFNFWQRWLLAVSIIIVVFGTVIALLSWSPPFAIFSWLVNATFWAGSVPDQGTQSFQLWAYGMLGATMAGWCVFLAYIVRYPFARKEAWAWECVAVGVATWFIIDTAISAYVMAYFNVVVNLLIFVLIALPMIMTGDEFKKNK